MRAIIKALPQENIIYFGDTARLPYGNKSADTVLRYCLENANFLQNLGIKLLVVACHTACSHGLEVLTQKLSIPVVGVLSTGIEEAMRISARGHIAVLGTKGTISSGVYQNKLKQKIPHAEIQAIACPLFVPLVEEGYYNHDIARAVTREYLAPLKEKQVDTVLLACTHYPLLEEVIQEELSPVVKLIDPAESCAQHVKELLAKHHMGNDSQNSPQYTFFVSDDPEKFTSMGKIFLGHPIHQVFLTP